MTSYRCIYQSTKTAATALRSARSIRRKAEDGSTVLHCRKISGSWILCRGRDIPDNIIGTAEAAKRMGRSKRCIQQLCKDGLLDAVKVGGVWLVKLH